MGTRALVRALSLSLAASFACKGEPPGSPASDGEAGTSDATTAHDTSVGPLAQPDAAIEPIPDAASLTTGPDGAPPIACDVDAAPMTQCTVAPRECGDGGAVAYSGGWCVGGTCRWLARNTTCTGGADQLASRCAPPGSPTASGAAFADDAGTWAVSGPCLVPVPAPPSPPQVSCDGSGGGDAGVCPPPRSVCVSGLWLLFYDQGECVSGQCSWQERYVVCADGCASGACIIGVATPPPM